jgi:SAM-dependent methyltransferase
MKQTWPAPERNKQPILDVLRRVLPERGDVLEIASGTGQHSVFFAEQLPMLSWQPSDLDPDNLTSIEAWVTEAQRDNLRKPVRIDVCDGDWNVGTRSSTVSAIFCANMIHIAPWECTLGLIEGASRHLAQGGRFVLYGPFTIGGEHTADSNATFDASLKARDPRWGVRDSDVVIALAEKAGLRFLERIPMPANNQTLVFEHN